MLKRTKKVPPAPLPETSGAVYEATADYVANVRFLKDTRWVYIRKVTKKKVTFVTLIWHAQSEKMRIDEWEERVIHHSIHPASDSDKERFRRMTSSWIKKEKKEKS